ncbi:HNH endonuclease signature motif containing protein [Mycobacterium sp. NPDC049093]
MTAQILTQARWRALVDGKYVVNMATGCWQWTGRTDRWGYGVVRINMGGRRRETGAHKASWIAHRGPIPGLLTVDHLCQNTLCVNPFHMEPVTNQENIRRRYQRSA